MLRSPTLPARQRGAVLFIALIVLVSMLIAAVGLMRSINTTTDVSTNLALREGAVASAERGIQAGFAWLLTQAGTGGLNADASGSAYFSARPATEPDFANASYWESAVGVAAAGRRVVNDSTGASSDSNRNRVYFVVHRMCTEPNAPYNGTGATGNPNQCALYTPTTAGSGNSMSSGSYAFAGVPQTYYRITSASIGPKGTVAVVQTMAIIPQ